MNRNEKIKTLTGLMQGKLRVSDLLPETVSVWYKPNGLYKGKDRGNTVEYTEEEFRAFCNRQNPKTKVLAFVPVAGCEPLADHE
jgi:hypothetical protein